MPHNSNEVREYTLALWDNGAYSCSFTGSRAICPDHAALWADIDYIILGTERTREHLRESGFTHETRFRNYPASLFNSFRKTLSSGIPLNFIVTEDRKFYNRFVISTKLAKDLKLTKREDRVKLFATIRSI